MEDEEDFKSKDQIKEEIENLPDINQKQRNQFFQLSDFKSDEMDRPKDNSSNAASPGQPVTADKTKTNNFINTSDKLKDLEEGGSPKNGTVTGSDHKLFSKYTTAKKVGKNDETPISHSKSMEHPEKEEVTSNKPKEEDEISHKVKNKWPK